MKPFLGIDITQDKKNKKENGQEFLVAKPSHALEEALESSTDQTLEHIEQTMLPLPVRIIQWICGIVGALIVCGILKAQLDEDAIPLALVYQNAAWLFWLAGGCLILWGILTYIGHKKEKTVLESDEHTHVLSKLDNIYETIFNELEVPSSAQEIDILSFSYKVKNGIPVAKEIGIQFTPYENFIYKIFADSETLFISNLDGKYAFPRSTLSAIRKVKKHISVPTWNKETAFNKGEYKQYRLSEDKYGCIHMNLYYILELSHNGETWGIYFPNYELPIIETITGLHPIE